MKDQEKTSSKSWTYPRMITVHAEAMNITSFSIQNKKLTVFSLSCYILVDVMKSNNYCWLVKLTVKRDTLLKKWSDLCCVLLWVARLAFSLSNHLITLYYLMIHKTLKRSQHQWRAWETYYFITKYGLCSVAFLCQLYSEKLGDNDIWFEIII